MAPEFLTCDVPASETITAHRIAYYRWNNNKTAQETVLCVHGLTRNARDFDFLAQSLAGRYRVIAPDMPGRGKSQYLADPTATLPTRHSSKATSVKPSFSPTSHLVTLTFAVERSSWRTSTSALKEAILKSSQALRALGRPSLPSSTLTSTTTPTPSAAGW